MLSHCNEYAIRHKVDKCLQKVAHILDTNREATICQADKVSHRYEDKYLLADHLTKVVSVCYANSLEQIGLSRHDLALLKSWSSQRSISLRFVRNQHCKFVKEIERDVEDPSRVQVEALGGMIRSTVKVITKVKEYIYVVDEAYELLAFSGIGDNPAEKVMITGRSTSKEICIRTSNAPFPEASKWDFEVNISWLLQHLDGTAEHATFCIDRSHPSCATPRRNPDIHAALHFAEALHRFCSSVLHHLRAVYDAHTRYGDPRACRFDISSVQCGSVFNPVVPLLEEPCENTVGSQAVANPSQQVVLPGPVVSQLLEEHRRSLAAACADQEAMFLPATPTAAPTNELFTYAESALMLVLTGLAELAGDYCQSVQFIEDMLRAQLVAAVGRELSLKDFAQYMTFHNRKVFREAFQPRPFSFAVRRSVLHSPEGQLQILVDTDSNSAGETTLSEPIYTVSHSAERAAPMEFALNATSTVKFGGERHLHGWMAHRFSGQSLPALQLVAQARQFSSYIVLIGRIVSAKVFQPKYGFIVQNKDELSIPLELEQIPTAKEFKDAISSLSPEQQRFAKAYRSMQLESTLFGVCVIQIKPQLEKVLKLPADSLTKEIKLTQDLMQLFIKYQIPTDLLSFDPAAWQGSGQGGEASAAERVLAVKKHVQAMQEMLLAAKEEEIAEKDLERAYKHRNYAPSQTESDHSSSCDEEENCDDSFYGERDCCEEAVYELAEARPQRRTMASRLSKMVGKMTNSGLKSSAVARCAAPEPMMSKCSADASIEPCCEVSAADEIASSAAEQPADDSAQKEPTLSAKETEGRVAEGSAEEAAAAVDYTRYPGLLEEMYGKYDPESSLRPTIINLGSSWTKRAQASLLSTPVASTLGADEQAREKSAAFDLLDALTRSGALPVEHASLHVVIAATHCFDDSLMDTVVQRNVNPIERVERSTLIMAATLHGCPAPELVQESQVGQVCAFSPMLFQSPAAALLEGAEV